MPTRFDIEFHIDNRITRTVGLIGDSDMRLKMACVGAGSVVGSYNGTTAIIAKRSKRSVSTVENWAHAYWLMAELRRNMSDFKRVRELWRKLPASHWWLAYDIQTAGYDALFYLDNAEKHAWSGRDMIKNYEAAREAGNAPLLYHRAVSTMVQLSMEVARSQKTNAKQKKAIAQLLDAFNINLETGE